MQITCQCQKAFHSTLFSKVARSDCAIQIGTAQTLRSPQLRVVAVRPPVNLKQAVEAHETHQTPIGCRRSRVGRRVTSQPLQGCFLLCGTTLGFGAKSLWSFFANMSKLQSSSRPTRRAGAGAAGGERKKPPAGCDPTSKFGMHGRFRRAGLFSCPSSGELPYSSLL